jgi:hypothetical protein
MPQPERLKSLAAERWQAPGSARTKGTTGVRVPGGIFHPTAVPQRQRLQRTAGRGMLTGSLNTRDALPPLCNPA